MEISSMKGNSFNCKSFIEQVLFLLWSRVLFYSLSGAKEKVRDFKMLRRSNRVNGARSNKILFDYCYFHSLTRGLFTSDDRRKWMLDQELNYLKFMLEACINCQSCHPKRMWAEIRVTFWEMIRWRQICIDALLVYEGICNPPGRITRSPIPMLIWHDLSETYDFLKIAYEVRDQLMIVVEAEDVGDPAWLAIQNLNLELSGTQRPRSKLDQKLDEVLGRAAFEN